jgi:hypothetical protein
MPDLRKRETIEALPPDAAERSSRGTSSSAGQGGQVDSASPARPSNKTGKPAKREYAETPALLGDGWRITTGAAEAAGLTDEERSKAQAVVDGMKREMEESVKERMIPDEAASDPSKDIRGFRISALPDRGVDFRTRYKNGLRTAVGEEKGDMLYGALAKGSFGGYGKYDVDLKFYPSSRTGAAGSHDLEWTHRDPDTKKALGTSGVANEHLDRFWGDVFK